MTLQFILGPQGNMTVSAFFIIYIGRIGHAMWSDATSMRISNWVSIILLASFALFASLHLQLNTALMHVAVASAVFLVGFSCYVMHWMGGGDVKLLAATSVWMGPGVVLPFLFDVAVFGGLLAICALAVRHVAASRLLKPRSQLARTIVQRSTAGQIPYGVPIGCAALATCTAALPCLVSSAG